MKLYAVVDKFRKPLPVQDDDLFLDNGMYIRPIEFHTYDPASQVVVDSIVYEYARQIVEDVYRGADCEPDEMAKKFLSASKEAI